MKALSVIAVSLVFAAGIATARSVNVEVQGTAGPWDCGLNPAYQYGAGNSAPTVISTASGFSFSAGLSLTVSYVSGLVDSVSGDGFYNATGNTNPPAIDGSIWAFAAPSYYMDPATYPIWRGELVGTFANNSGHIVGTPFAIGNLGTFTIPSGATQLQLGVNDTLHNDNLGSWTVQISQIPEPMTASLVLVGLGGLGLAARRCRRSEV